MYKRDEKFENIKGVITEIKRFATHDGPGIRTTIFCKGCPLHCKWCSNPETQNLSPQLYFIYKKCENFGTCVDACPAKAIGMEKYNKINRSKCSLCMKCVEKCPNSAFQVIGREVNAYEVYKQAIKDLSFYGDNGGVTLSGGEPLYQPDFTIAVLKLCHENNISTVLDTSGFAPSKVVEKAMEFTDIVLLDIKHMDPKKHSIGTSMSNKIILENALLMSKKSKIRISLPLIPDFNDDATNLNETAKFANELGVDCVDILPLHMLGSEKYKALGIPPPYEEFKIPSKKDVEKAVSVFHTHGLKTTIGRMM